MLCKCCTKHIPKPINYVFIDNTCICPTGASNLESLLLEWDTYGGEPPGYVLKSYSAYIKGLAKRARL